jgi:hypothetical protein
MVGYQGWTNERAAINDAFLPILADGIKWSGYTPNGKFVYNLGWYGDSWSENESFNKNDNTFARAAVWLPTPAPTVALAPRRRIPLGVIERRFLRYRSKPNPFRRNPTHRYGKFAAEHSYIYGLEPITGPAPSRSGRNTSSIR